MHLQQTKRGSIATGGPQYYFHDLTDSVRTYLRKKGAVRVALVTPYGATKSDFFAVGKDHKLTSGKVATGNVGHDRIQQGSAEGSIGEAVRHWYCLRTGNFERIDVDVQTVDDVFYVRPLRCKYASGSKNVDLEIIERPLTFTQDYQSAFWRRHLHGLDPGLVIWSLEEICRIVRDHRPGTRLPHIQELDILRASGPLRHLGLRLGGFVGKGYDCYSEFKFADFPPYSVPVELKRDSTGFHYQQRKYGKEELSRAVVLCASHGHKQVPVNIDIIALDALCEYLPRFTASV
ncbi:MAG: hypothetical protein Q7J25_11835 [Vicinamibacterales bacterium]|nr:hypothetical protein [Vicinamibacterales bacterium]